MSRLVQESAKVYGNRTALLFKDHDKEEWKPISWTNFSNRTIATSLSMLALGIGVQENLAIFSQNRPEYLYCELGGYGIRAVTIPFYATTSGAQVSYMVNDAGIRLIFVGEQQQYDALWDVVSLCQTLEHIVIFDRKVQRNKMDHLSMYFDEFIRLGQEKKDSVLAEYHRRQAEASFDDTANILYTSGTTGLSKGVILLHSQYKHCFWAHLQSLPLCEKDVTIDFLPFTHVFEGAWSKLCLTCGVTLAINDRPQDIQKSLQEVHPTCMCSVPRFWEKVYQGVLDKADKAGGLQKKLIHDAIAVGGEYWEKYKSKGIPAPFALKMKYEMYQRTIIKVLRKALGLERANFFPTAGASVSPEVERFAHAAGINMLVGYGLTETCATVTFDTPGTKVTMGSIGRPLPGVEVRIGDGNEIQVKAPTVMPKYYKKETETLAAFTEDGWFRTGDAGYIKDGELYITDRIKDLYKTSNGKYIAPQLIEGKLTIDKCFDQCVIIADKRKFVSALIVPNYDVLQEWAEAHDIKGLSRPELCTNERVRKFVFDRIETLQQDLAHYEKVKRFTLLPEAFTLEKGEITNTLKIKRRVVYQNYAAQIDEMYQEPPSNSPH